MPTQPVRNGRDKKSSFFTRSGQSQHRSRELQRRFLRQVVADPMEDPALVWALEELRVISLGRDAVLGTVERNRRHADRRQLGQLALGVLGGRIAGRESVAMAVRVD